MLKYAALLFNTIALLIYQFFFADVITVKQNFPSSAKADSEFTVELTINKGSIGGFAKLQQDLPEGFTAVQDDNNGASFTFTNQAVKFIWMSLPSDKEFKIKYKVKVAPGISGDKVIAGKFSYVSDNVKQSIDIAPSTITIGDKTSEPIATTTTEPVTTVTEPTTTTTTTTTSTEPSSITCVRTLPANVTDNFTVEILINKGNVTGFAKLLETLPAGFTASAGESEGAAFSFDATTQKVKFVWVSMPSQTEFRISYKVAVASGMTGTQNIDGVFSYIENDETKKYVLTTSSVTIAAGAAIVADNTTTTNTATEPVKTNTTTTTTTTNNNTTTDNSLSVNNTIPSPQGNVNYRVQIMALHNAVDANSLASRYNISSKVNIEMAEGFTKYTVGSHNEYKEARDARENIKNKGVVGPFVTAYSTGKRITVQEALMITSQKWYR